MTSQGLPKNGMMLLFPVALIQPEKRQFHRLAVRKDLGTLGKPIGSGKILKVGLSHDIHVGLRDVLPTKKSSPSKRFVLELDAKSMVFNGNDICTSWVFRIPLVWLGSAVASRVHQQHPIDIYLWVTKWQQVSYIKKATPNSKCSCRNFRIHHLPCLLHHNVAATLLQERSDWGSMQAHPKLIWAEV